MDLLDLLKATGGGDSVGKIAGSLGLGSADTSKLVAALAPALMGGLQKSASAGNGLDGLRNALQKGGHERYIDKPDLMTSDDTRNDGNKILGHIFGSKDVSRKVAAAAADDTGISAGLIKKALPLLATLAMGAMSKKTSGGKSGGGLGGLLSSGGDLIGLARKFF